MMIQTSDRSISVRAGSALIALCAGVHALDVTLDKNGYEPVVGGQVTGTGLPAAIPIPADAKPLVLCNLQAGGIYAVDFFHNAGLGGSDFSFTINPAGTGIASVSPGGNTFVVVKGFESGATSIVLNTFPVTFNANRTLSHYYVGGLIAHGTVTNSEPITRTALPGWYRVDNLFNSGEGNEDFNFVVHDDGRVGVDTGRYVDRFYVAGGNNDGYAFLMNADGTGSWVFTNAPSYEEYARFEGSQVHPRACRVHFRVESSTNNPASFTYTWRSLSNTTNVAFAVVEGVFDGGTPVKMSVIATIGEAVP